MKARFTTIATALSLLALASCDSDGTCEPEPDYSVHPGVWTCETIIEECGGLCEVVDDSEDYCSYDTVKPFSDCAGDVIARENLQGVSDRIPDLAREAAMRVIVSSPGPDCYTELSGLDVFCYGCKD